MRVRTKWTRAVWVAACWSLFLGCRAEPVTPPEPAPEPGNTPPVIESVTASALVVDAGGTLLLEARAHDADPGDTLSLAWTAAVGEFQRVSETQTHWTAPREPGVVVLTLTVTDSRGASATQSLSVRVMEGGGIILNFSPRVSALTAEPTRVSVGGSTTVVARASDPDRDVLTSAWSATGCTGTWSEPAYDPGPDTGPMNARFTVQFTARTAPTGDACDCRLEVTVSDGRGGTAADTVPLCVDAEPPPPSGAWAASGGLSWGRDAMAVSLLDSGEVLVSGGWTRLDGWAAEVYNPRTNLSLPTGPMVDPSRVHHSSTLLPSGEVLVAGGGSATAELYDPRTHVWRATGSMAVSRSFHTATRLPSGRVLVVGGDADGVPSSAEVYEPQTGLWRTVAPPTGTYSRHTATLLPSGRVLVAGSGTRAELFDPTTETWSAAAPMRTGRSRHVAVLLGSGEVLVAGGENREAGWLTDAELYDPAANAWRPTGAMTHTGGWMTPSATVLSTGKVLLADGSDTLELYDPASGTWAGKLVSERAGPSLVALASGQVVLLPSDWGFFSVQRFQPDMETFRNEGPSPWIQERLSPTVTPLATGRLLVVGSLSDVTELVDPATQRWTPTPPMSRPRQGHTATLLPSGRVLAVGGLWNQAPDDTADLYDPASGTWSPTTAPEGARAWHTATLLPSGRVLVVGGLTADFTSSASAWLYDPASGTWTATGALADKRARHTATLLASGQVLVVGGRDDDRTLATAERYDPASGTWSPAGRLSTVRARHTATRLPSGEVVVLGGSDQATEVEVYDPAAGTWSPRGELLVPHAGHSVTPMPSGDLLVIGGDPLPRTVERYTPGSGTSTALPDAATPRTDHAAVLLPSGQVWVVGGFAQGFGVSLLYTP
ncbi:kelch repeat-containing protein [Archangium primigenium]|uniref:kelch repeat-containing protein n=1 Tax=[Archangium] primigenium TaxID=2792470 RepID=UPI00195DC2E1|nr:kelch-like protein [Archangium primigenium]